MTKPILKTMLLMLVVMGMATHVYAQERFMLVQATSLSVCTLDTSRIVQYANSKLLDSWMKDQLTERGRVAAKESAKHAKFKDRSETERRLKTSYQLLHLQFDPITFKYKVLEIESYDEGGQLLASDTALSASGWVPIPADSPEERMLTCISNFMQANADKVNIR